MLVLCRRVGQVGWSLTLWCCRGLVVSVVVSVVVAVVGLVGGLLPSLWSVAVEVYRRL